MPTFRRHPDKMLKPERAKLIKMFHRVMADAGAIKNTSPHAMYEYSLDTHVGNLELGASDGISGGVNIFGRFAMPSRAAAAGTGCNPFSGKWNHHYLSRITAVDAMEDFKRDLFSVYR